jgi:hypothetical protein
MMNKQAMVLTVLGIAYLAIISVIKLPTGLVIISIFISMGLIYYGIKTARKRPMPMQPMPPQKIITTPLPQPKPTHAVPPQKSAVSDSDMEIR